MFYIWLSLGAIGFVLSSWAYLSLPKGTNMAPIPPKVRIKTGAYRFMKHPMYVGNVLFVSGMAGMAAGFWNAFAVGTVTEMLMRSWVILENET